MTAPTQPNASTLFDTLIKNYGLKNDAALCRKLGVQPPAISKARRFGNLTDGMIVRVRDAFDMQPREVRALAKQ